MYVERISKNIKNAIIRELTKATTEIFLAVAWFTDTTLLNILTDKVKEGVVVKILINDDEINAKTDFDKFITSGGNLFKLPATIFLHDKSCVIDRKTIITGSYNWTFSASNVNLEKITIIYDAQELALTDTYEYQNLINFYFTDYKKLNDRILPNIAQEIKGYESVNSNLKYEDYFLFFKQHKTFFFEIISKYYPLKRDFLIKHEQKLDWKLISLNKNINWTDEFIDEFSKKLFWGWYGYDEYEGESGLSSNTCVPWTINFIRKYYDQLEWSQLSENIALPWSNELLHIYEKKWHWDRISINSSIPWSIDLIIKYKNNWENSESKKWDSIISNQCIPWSSELIRLFVDKWDWKYLSINPSVPWGNTLIELYASKINWEALSANRGLDWSEHLLLSFWQKWDWNNLCANPSLPWTIEFFNEISDKISWGSSTFFYGGLSSNEGFPWTFDFINQNINNIAWYSLGKNKGVSWSENFIDSCFEKLDVYNDISDITGLPINVAKGGLFKGLSENSRLPWSRKLIEKYDEFWDYYKLSSNIGICWDLYLLTKYEKKLKWHLLVGNESVYNKGFKPFFTVENIDLLATDI